MIREPYDDDRVLQWNKMWGMQMETDEPICVMDIDVPHQRLRENL